MVWGRISLEEKTDFVVTPEIFTAARFVLMVLLDHVSCCICNSPEFLFMQDNARTHTAAITMHFLREH